MILVDSSVWVDHLRTDDETLVNLLRAEHVLTHPFVIGEIALGHIRQRDIVLKAMQDLPQARVVSDREVRLFIEHHRLFGQGIGYIDAHLLATVRLTLGASLWTRDKRLLRAARQLGLASGFIR